LEERALDTERKVMRVKTVKIYGISRRKYRGVLGGKKGNKDEKNEIRQFLKVRL
jgi:hypothetical protein